MNLQKTTYLLVALICLAIILIYGKSILIPLILGTLLWFIMKELKAGLNRIGFIKTNFPSWLKNILSVVIVLGVVFFMVDILTVNINALAHSIEKYQPNINSLISQIDGWTNLNVQDKLTEYAGNFEFKSILLSLFAAISDLLSNSFMIILYAVFVLLEEVNFRPKLQAIFLQKHQNDKVDSILEKIGKSISSYFRLKTLISLITGFSSYLVLWLIGVDAPFFWGFLIFILNFIPTIGSLIGTVFPAVFCLFQFGTFLPSILILVLVGFIQLIVGNFLEPRIMGSSMNISPLVTILSLSVWGTLWGIIGMILSVPIAVVAIIIFSQFEQTKAVAILLSEKGEVN